MWSATVGRLKSEAGKGRKTVASLNLESFNVVSGEERNLIEIQVFQPLPASFGVAGSLSIFPDMTGFFSLFDSTGIFRIVRYFRIFRVSCGQNVVSRIPAVEETGELLLVNLLPFVGQVGIQVKGDPRVSMTEEVLSGFDGYPCIVQGGGEGVPQIMGADGQAFPPLRLVPCDVPGFANGLTVQEQFHGEDVALPSILECAGRYYPATGRTADKPNTIILWDGGQGVEQGIAYRQDAHSCLSLGVLANDGLVVVGDIGGGTDLELAMFKIDIRPVEGDHFSTTESAQEHEHCPESNTMLLPMGQDEGHFPAFERSVSPYRPGREGEFFGRIVEDDFILVGLGEYLAYDHVILTYVRDGVRGHIKKAFLQICLTDTADAAAPNLALDPCNVRAVVAGSFQGDLVLLVPHINPLCDGERFWEFEHPAFHEAAVGISLFSSFASGIPVEALANGFTAFGIANDERGLETSVFTLTTFLALGWFTHCNPSFLGTGRWRRALGDCFLLLAFWHLMAIAEALGKHHGLPLEVKCAEQTETFFLCGCEFWGFGLNDFLHGRDGRCSGFFSCEQVLAGHTEKLCDRGYDECRDVNVRVAIPVVYRREAFSKGIGDLCLRNTFFYGNINNPLRDFGGLIFLLRNNFILGFNNHKASSFSKNSKFTVDST